MYSQILVPVDLHGTEPVAKAIDVATDMARFYGARITLINVSGSQHTDAPHTQKDVEAALNERAEEVRKTSDHDVDTKYVFSPDVPAEVDSILMSAINEVGADLVVVGSHVPHLLDYVFSSHAGRLANHAKCSVFVVR